jgi:hypothetical protein
MKVRANTEYIYYPNALDRIDGRTTLLPGDIVKVVNLPGCPKANTMNHAHVELNGLFMGLVSTGSLYSMKDRQIVIDAIRRDLEQSYDATKTPNQMFREQREFDMGETVRNYLKNNS